MRLHPKGKDEVTPLVGLKGSRGKVVVEEALCGGILMSG